MLDYVLRQLQRFNHWYDKQREPKRPLLFFVPMILAIAGLDIGPAINSPFITVTATVVFSIITVVGLSRALTAPTLKKTIGLFLLLALLLILIL